MSTLRVLLSAAPTATRADAWALYDDQGRLVRDGRDTPAAQPDAQRREAVLAADAVRIIPVQLPPMATDRVKAAAQYAVEDQLAGPVDEHALAVSQQDARGQVTVVVASAALLADLRAHFARVIAEPTLVLPSPAMHWRWCAAGNGESFVRTPDGGAFAVSGAPGGAVPAELKLALDGAARGGRSPPIVEVALGSESSSVGDGGIGSSDTADFEPTLAQWSAATGVAFERVAPWRWTTASAASFAKASELLPATSAGTVAARRPGHSSTWKYAAIIAVAALSLHLLATLGEWAKLRLSEWRTKQELDAVARTLDVRQDDEVSVTAARIARAHTVARHRAGKSADDDALPLLARAAPGLAALPSGALKSATYADGAWTFDLARLDAAPAAEFERSLAAAGLATLKAATASGLRIRATLTTGKT